MYIFFFSLYSFVCLFFQYGYFQKRFNDYIRESDQFRIVRLNIRSLNKNYGELLCFLQRLSKKFDVIALSETNRINDISLFRIENYRCIYNEGNINKCYGVVVFVKNDLNFSQNIVNLGPIECIEVELTQGTKKLLISCMYRSPSLSPQAFNNNNSRSI